MIQGPSLAVGPMGDAVSPLQIFATAKMKINDIFMDIDNYVHGTVKYMQSKYKGKLTGTGQGKLEFYFFWNVSCTLFIVH
jgi:hypothetical protein